MFAKLLKHEWRATKSVIALLCAIILIAGLTIGGVMHYMVRMDAGNTLVVEDTAIYVQPEMSDAAQIICILLIAMGVMAVGFCAAGSVVAVIYRFYMSRFTDEGYLTFTLPVNNHQLLLSSIINSLWSIFLVLAACAAAVLLAMALFLLAIPQQIKWADLSVPLANLWTALRQSVSGHEGRLLLFLVGIAVSAVSQLLHLMLAMTVGALLTKKHKILMTFLVYYGIGAVETALYGAAGTQFFPAANADWMLGFPGLMGAASAVICYFLIHYLTSRKLNLT